MMNMEFWKINHNVTLTTDRFGNMNSAYQFNGNNSYINVGMISSPSFTYNAWVRLDTFPATRDSIYAIISRLSNFYNYDNAEMNVSWYGNVGSQIGDKLSGLQPGSCLSQISYNFINTAGQSQNYIDTSFWYNISLSYNNATKVSSIYLDGSLISRLSIPANFVVANCGTSVYTYSVDSIVSLYIGARPVINSQIGYFFNGAIDDIGIYTRALSDSEVYNLYTVNYGVFNPTDTTRDTIITYIHDTLYTNVIDTTHIILHDTTYTHIIDTTCSSHDTIFTNITDTLYTHIMDTIYNSDTLIIPVTTGLSPNGINYVNIYPNPTRDHIYINCGNFNTMSGYSIKINNLLGQSIFQSPISQPYFYVSLASFGGSGTYFVEILNGSQTIVETKIIILQ